jgi:hypothetical protein
MTLRTVVSKGMPYASQQLFDEHRARWREFFQNPENDKFFIDKAQFLKDAGGSEEISEEVTKSDIKTTRASVDAASLVFIHSAVDGAVSDLCRVCALAKPEDWGPYLQDRKVALKEISSSSYPDILRTLLNDALATLEREALLKRVDRIFALCQPSDFRPMRDFAFDRDRLESLDRKRHEIVHGQGVELTDVEHDMEFLVRSGFYLFALVNQRYDVRINPAAFDRAMQALSAPSSDWTIPI